MTDIKQKAEALISDVQREEPKMGNHNACYNALCRAIEQHEAYRQEVSDAVVYAEEKYGAVIRDNFGQFIIPAPKPDPLVEVFEKLYLNTSCIPEIHAALEARGLEIRSKNDALKIAREAAIEECAKVAEEYPSPMNDLPMVLAIRTVATAIRALREQER